MCLQQLRRETGPALFGLKKSAAGLLSREYLFGVLLPVAMVGLYWLAEECA